MPADEPLSEQKLPRTGVVICGCGGQISAGIDTGALAERAAGINGVTYVGQEDYPCNAFGLERLRKAVQEHHLERVLIAGCAPRLVEKLFAQALQPVQLEPGNLSIVNVRELAVGSQAGGSTGWEQAACAIEMGVARLDYTRTTQPHTGEVTRAALVIGSGLSGLTAALGLAERSVPVTLIESGDAIGRSTPGLPVDIDGLAQKRAQAALSHPLIHTMLHTRLTAVSGHPGHYEVRVQQNGQTTSLPVGAVIVANMARPKEPGSRVWFDRSRVQSQAEFEGELKRAEQDGLPLETGPLVMILCADESQKEHCSRVCCNIGIRQALRVKNLNEDANVTVLFREIYLGSTGDADLARARKAGVTFFRYGQETPPVIGDRTIVVQDMLTGEPVEIPYGRAVLSMPLVPAEDSARLAALFGLPQDEFGFLAEPRVRLRPGRYADSGIYIIGSGQLPADTPEALFQAYLASARALRLLNQETIQVDSPAAEIDEKLCSGCGNCPQVCPVEAIHLEARDGILSVSEVDALRCVGCGNCVVVCPVKAISLPGWDNIEIPAQISAALDERGFRAKEKKVLIMACEWSAYGAAEMAGHRRLAYPPGARILRMNCSARFDPFHILWAFLNGADGVLLGACSPGECHYGMGNLYAKERVEILQQELVQHGVDPKRLRLVYLAVNDGARFAQAVTDFAKDLQMDGFSRRTIW